MPSSTARLGPSKASITLARPLSLVALILALSAMAQAAFSQDEYKFHKVVGQWDVSAQKGAPPIDASAVTLTDAQGRKRQLDRQLGGSIEDVVAFEASRLVIILNGNRLAVVDPNTAKVIDTFDAVNTAFSPTHRFMAFTAIVPRWAEASELYLVYDLTLSPEQNCMATRCGGLSQGIAVYPDENRRDRSYRVTGFDATRDDAPRPSDDVVSAMHGLRSDLFWLTETRFAFLDCTRKSSQVVLVDLQGGVVSVRTASFALDVPAAVDAAKLPVQETSVDGRRWLLAESINLQNVRGEDVSARVWLQWHAYMKITYTDVRWSLSAR